VAKQYSRRVVSALGHDRPRGGRYDRADMPWWTIVCCAVFGLLVLTASVYAVVATIRMLRTLDRFTRTLEAASLELTPRLDALSAQSETTAAGQQVLRESLAQLAASRARLGVLLWAIEDVRRLIAAYRWLTPAG
jgi:hypothetical protein